MTIENVAIIKNIDDQVDSKEVMEAKNSQNQEKLWPTDFNSNNSNNKDKNVVGE